MKQFEVIFISLFLLLAGLIDVIGSPDLTRFPLVDQDKTPAVRPASIFQSHMVLQQDKPIHVWGTAVPHSEIRVSLENKTLVTIAGENGDWMVTFPSRKASFQAIKLKINEIILDDILIGEVWICAGQSNMVRPLKEAEGGMEAFQHSNQNGIRLCRYEYPPLVARTGYRQEDLDRCNIREFFKEKWTLNTIENAADFSSVAWIFGNRLSENLNIPVGLIQLAVGGSAINNWISPQTLKADPETASLFTTDWLNNEDVDLGHRNRCKDAFQNVLPQN
ncbi:MAG: sialate O-acetylesterase, partial [Bacteroidales bacterium]|nr:sialate O-acetylesterase [Bacteroidales bacterium]